MGKLKQLHIDCEDGNCKQTGLKCNGYGSVSTDV